MIADIDGHKRVEILGSSTIPLFDNIFKGTGRNRINGVKKRRLKIHTKLLLTPNMVHITESAYNDKKFLRQLNFQPNTIYVFDKGYVNYKRWHEINEKEA